MDIPLQTYKLLGRPFDHERLEAKFTGLASFFLTGSTNSIWELRKAVGDDAKCPRYIQTVPRKGYHKPHPFPRVG
jgi:DNA-binding response OmpR family regulator